MVQALSVDSLGSGFSPGPRGTDEAPSLATSEPPGCLQVSKQADQTHSN